jgi:hypothetical protein
MFFPSSHDLHCMPWFVILGMILLTTMQHTICHDRIQILELKKSHFLKCISLCRVVLIGMANVGFIGNCCYTKWMAFPNLLGLMWFMGWIHISYIVAYNYFGINDMWHDFLMIIVCCSLDFENHSYYLGKVPPCLLHAMCIYVKFMYLEANLQSVMHNYDSHLHNMNAFLIPMHLLPKIKNLYYICINTT